MLEKLQGLQTGLQAHKKMIELRNDFTVLKNIWFKKLADTEDHAERLEHFYGAQAHACKPLCIFLTLSLHRSHPSLHTDPLTFKFTLF